MNLTFFDRAFWWDVLFAAVLLLCIRGAAKRGAFRALSGLAGTLLGVFFGNLFQGDLAPYLEPLLQPVMRSLAQKADLAAVTGLQQGSVLSDLVQEGALADKMSALYETLLESLADVLTASLAPILAFFLIFAATKLALRLVCALLDWDIPLLSGLNRMAGGGLYHHPGAVLGGDALRPGGKCGSAEPALPAGKLFGWTAGSAVLHPHSLTKRRRYYERF